VLKRAKRWHLVSDEIKMLPKSHNVGRALEDDEKLILLKAADSNPNWQVAKCATKLVLNTTMRKCEIRGLQWRHVDFIDRTAAIRRKTTKTDAGERIIPLNDEAMSAIFEMRERAKAFLGDDLSPCWFVFFRHPGFSGAPDPTRPMGPKAWRTAYRKMVKKAGLTGFRFHDLRHHCITELAESGEASDETLMGIAGHLSKKMIEHYSHIRMKAKRRAVEALSMVRKPAQTAGQIEGGYVTNHVTKSGSQTHHEPATC